MSTNSTTSAERHTASLPPPSLNYANIIRPFGYSSMECGYCKGTRASVISKTPTDCSKSYGILAESMTPPVYEALVYRGWRRSGIHLYKPTNFESCCPTLTIRLLTDQFHPTKSQAKIQRKLRQLLVEPIQIQTTSVDKTTKNTQRNNSNHSVFESYLKQKTSILTTLEVMIRQALLESKYLVTPETNLSPTNITLKVRPFSKQQETQQQIVLTSSICAQLAGKTKIPRDPLLQSVLSYLKQQPLNGMPIHSIEAHEKSGQILITLQMSSDSWEEAMRSQNAMSFEMDDKVDKLGDWYKETTGKVLMQHQRKLRIETIPSHQSALEPQVHQLYVQYQHVVHQDPDPYQHAAETDADTKDNNSSNINPIEAISKLDWGPHCPERFQSQVTAMLNDYLSPHPQHIQKALLDSYYNFYQFLIESPFDTKGDCGSYHQQYWIGELLIAVGVVDILPKGLSSVYLYYHPAMAHSLIPLGKLAILEEIEYTRRILKRPYYYLGYYIESCTKMRYKADYQPSQLLCPVHYQWIDCSKAIPKLKQTPHHVCSLIDTEKEKDETKERNIEDSALAEIPMDIGAGMTVTLEMLQDNGKDVVRPILQEFFNEAGHEVCQQCLVKLT